MSAISTVNTTHMPYNLYNTPLDASLRYLYPYSHTQPVTVSAFVTAHGCLFKKGPISDHWAFVQVYLSFLKKYINQFGADFKIYSLYSIIQFYYHLPIWVYRCCVAF